MAILRGMSGKNEVMAMNCYYKLELDIFLIIGLDLEVFNYINIKTS